jgi:hypothetical protein
MTVLRRNRRPNSAPKIWLVPRLCPETPRRTAFPLVDGFTRDYQQYWSTATGVLVIDYPNISTRQFLQRVELYSAVMRAERSALKVPRAPDVPGAQRFWMTVRMVRDGAAKPT